MNLTYEPIIPEIAMIVEFATIEGEVPAAESGDVVAAALLVFVGALDRRSLTSGLVLGPNSKENFLLEFWLEKSLEFLLEMSNTKEMFKKFRHVSESKRNLNPFFKKMKLKPKNCLLNCLPGRRHTRADRGPGGRCRKAPCRNNCSRSSATRGRDRGRHLW